MPCEIRFEAVRTETYIYGEGKKWLNLSENFASSYEDYLQKGGSKSSYGVSLSMLEGKDFFSGWICYLPTHQHLPPNGQAYHHRSSSAILHQGFMKDGGFPYQRGLGPRATGITCKPDDSGYIVLTAEGTDVDMVNLRIRRVPPIEQIAIAEEYEESMVMRPEGETPPRPVERWKYLRELVSGEEFASREKLTRWGGMFQFPLGQLSEFGFTPPTSEFMVRFSYQATAVDELPQGIPIVLSFQKEGFTTSEYSTGLDVSKTPCEVEIVKTEKAITFSFPGSDRSPLTLDIRPEHRGITPRVFFRKSTGSVLLVHQLRIQEEPVTMSETDALIFSDGQWTNEKTGEVIPDGTLVQGTRGVFRIEQEDGIGKVVKLIGDGATGQAKYVKLPNGGNAITVSGHPWEYLDELHKEFEESGIKIGEDDVFVFSDGQWKNEKTGDMIPTGTLVAGTGGLFRMEQENDEGKITSLVGGGATGHGKFIRWSVGGNAFSGGSKP